MPSATTCPYCNATIPLTGPSAGGRVACPRCGELVPIRADSAGRVTDTGSTGPALIDGPPPRTNRQVAMFVLGVMGLMAGVALVYALSTVAFRRANDTKNKASEVVEEGELPVADLSGFGFLPADTQAVAGARLHAALTGEVGKAVLTALGIGEPTATVFGLRPDEVDHVVIGLGLKALPPRVVTAVRARQASGVTALRETLAAGRGVERGAKTLYTTEFWKKGPNGLVWLPDPRTVVAGLVKEDFDKLPDPPAGDARHLADPLPDLLRRRIDPQALAWLAVQLPADDATAALALAFVPLAAADREAWSGLRGLAVSVRAEGPKATLEVHLLGKDPPATARLDELLERSVKTAGIAVTTKQRDRDWLRLTAGADAETIAKWLAGFRGGTGR